VVNPCAVSLVEKLQILTFYDQKPLITRSHFLHELDRGTSIIGPRANASRLPYATLAEAVALTKTAAATAFLDHAAAALAHNHLDVIKQLHANAVAEIENVRDHFSLRANRVPVYAYTALLQLEQEWLKVLSDLQDRVDELAHELRYSQNKLQYLSASTVAIESIVDATMQWTLTTSGKTMHRSVSALFDVVFPWWSRFPASPSREGTNTSCQTPAPVYSARTRTLLDQP
jgi:hypothetical protein